MKRSRFLLQDWQPDYYYERPIACTTGLVSAGTLAHAAIGVLADGWQRGQRFERASLLPGTAPAC